MKKLSRLSGLFVLVMLLLQFVPIRGSNPPVEQEVNAPNEVLEVLRESCWDCHSNETVWPWYSRVAPVSWLVVHDVDEGREHLNFSTWNRYDAKRRAHKIEEVWEEVEEGEMPLWFYVPLHPEAELSAADRDVLRRWAEAFGEDD